ncbi:MAG TPA: TIGR02266 family protein [Anaeromyxobacter sp.]
MKQPENKRRAIRLHHEIPVAYRSVGSFLTDWATNISRGGMFINTRKPLSVGTDVKILVQLPGMKFPYELAGRVTRVTEFDNHANMVPGMGVEFTNVDESRRREIDAFVDRLRRDLEEG